MGRTTNGNQNAWLRGVVPLFPPPPRGLLGCRGWAGRRASGSLAHCGSLWPLRLSGCCVLGASAAWGWAVWSTWSLLAPGATLGSHNVSHACLASHTSSPRDPSKHTWPPPWMPRLCMKSMHYFWSPFTILQLFFLYRNSSHSQSSKTMTLNTIPGTLDIQHSFSHYFSHYSAL